MMPRRSACLRGPGRARPGPVQGRAAADPGPDACGHARTCRRGALIYNRQRTGLLALWLGNLVEFLKLSLLASLLGAIGSWYAMDRFPEFAALSHGSLAGSVGHAMTLVVGGLGLSMLLLFALALFDVPFQCGWLNRQQIIIRKRPYQTQ